MATNPIITIKRSQSTDTPSSLANGELAYSFSSNKLFIGQTDTNSSPVTVEYIGGKLVVDKVANLENIIAGGGSISVSDALIANTLQLSIFTENGVLFAKANGVVDFVTGTSGKVMQIAANGTPVFDDLDGGVI